MLPLFILSVCFSLVVSLPRSSLFIHEDSSVSPLESSISYQIARRAIEKSVGNNGNGHSKVRTKRNLPPQLNPYGDMVPFELSDGQVKINISVGSPPQTVEVIADTGSPFTWVTVSDNSIEKGSDAFSPGKSTSWSKDNRTTGLAYLDSRRCRAEIGHDVLSVGNLSIPINIGMGSGTGCEEFEHGILGLSKDSDFVRSLAEEMESPVFSFSFKDPTTGQGENWFSVGGLGGLKEEEIIWTKDPNKGLRHFNFQIDMPYISYADQRFELPDGHSVMVDTGSSITILPDDVPEKLWTMMSPRLVPVRFPGPRNSTVVIPGYDMNGVGADERPAVAFRLGDREWISEIADTSAGQIPGSGGEETGLYFSAIYPKSILGQYINPEYIPSILGYPFWSNLKGFVFDFSTGNERVGLVPRIRLTNKSGLLNPMFVSAESGGVRILQGGLPLIWICGSLAALLLAL